MINALVIARDKHHQGGVVSFVELLMPNFSAEVRATRFVIGRSPDKHCHWGALLVAFRDAIRLIRSERNSHYDIIHINPSLNFNSAVRDGLFIAVLLAIKARHIVVFVHGWDAAFAEKIRRNRLARFIAQSLLQPASAILVLATAFKRELCAWGLDSRKVSVLTMMFDRNLFAGIERQRHCRKIRLLFLSRLIKEKGIHELLAAFLLLKNCVPGIELVIAGDGSEFRAVEQWITDHSLSDKVMLAGYLDGLNKAQALVDADIFLFPSYYGEGCPISLLEAMAAGLAIITTAVGGIPDIFADGVNGIVLSSVTPASIADATGRLINDEGLLTRIRTRNKQQAWERYEATSVTRTIEKTYKSIVIDSKR
jgi:glycosyltransferase involved in cell wall biosynthesis